MLIGVTAHLYLDCDGFFASPRLHGRPVGVSTANPARAAC